jgi:hypothetical protein
MSGATTEARGITIHDAKLWQEFLDKAKGIEI